MIYSSLYNSKDDKLKVDEHHMKTGIEYLLKNTNYSNIDINNLNLEQKYHKLVQIYFKKLHELEDFLWRKNNRKFKEDYFMLNKRATIHFIYDKNKIEFEKKRIENLLEAELFAKFVNKLILLGKTYYLIPYIEEVYEFYQTHETPSYYEIRIQHMIGDSPEKHSQLPNIDKKILMEKIKNIQNKENFKKFCKDFLVTYSGIVLTEDKTIEKKLDIMQFEQNKIDLDSNKIDLKYPIKSILGLKDRIVVQNSNDLCFYDCNTYSLINKMNFHFNSDIKMTNDGYIIGKHNWTNKVIFIDPKKLIAKEKYFVGSDRATITHVCSNDSIIMVNRIEDTLAYEETYIYSKYKDIYVLSRIIHERFSLAYDISPNLFMAKGRDGQYVYSVNNFDLCLKFKKTDYKNIINIDEHKLLAYKWEKNFIDILDIKSLNVVSSFQTKKFLEIKKINNKNIILSRDDGIYELIIKDTSQIFENKLINNRTKNIGIFGGFGRNKIFFQLEGKEIKENSGYGDLMIKFGTFNN